MNRIFACVFLSLGTVLVVYGLNDLNSVAAALSRLGDGSPPEPGLWFLLAGVGAITAGLAGLLRAPKRPVRVSRPGTSTPPQARTRTRHP